MPRFWSGSRASCSAWPAHFGLSRRDESSRRLPAPPKPQTLTRKDIRDMQDAPSVRQHFQTVAASFDSIYASPSLLDRIFRRDMYERFQRTLEECRPLGGKSVLDVGCGSGRYGVAFAEGGAREVVGVDFAPKMVDLALDNARRAGVIDRCKRSEERRVGKECGARWWPG